MKVITGMITDPFVTMETAVVQSREKRAQSARASREQYRPLSRCRSETLCRGQGHEKLGRSKSKTSFYGYQYVPISERISENVSLDLKKSQRSKFGETLSRDKMVYSIRPISAPEKTRQRCSRKEQHSARGKYRYRAESRTEGPRRVWTEEMHSVVKVAREAQTFQEETESFRSLERSTHDGEADDKKDSAPVFNKRLFASQGTVIMTREARRLMFNNAKGNESCDLDTALTKTEVQCLRCVTEGLKLIHKGQDFVKDVLSKVITYEIYKAFEYVHPKKWEDALSCYYILNGAVEVTYDLRSTESRNVYQANIIYSHGTGEYLGLVSPEGPAEDLAPPATIYTKELTQFIRVDRKRFHRIMQRATKMIDDRKRDYFSKQSFLVKVAEEVKEKILHKFSIQEYPANRVLLAQGDLTEYLFIIMSGRCQTYREVTIPEAEKKVLFYLTSRDPDDFFGEECIIDREQSVCTVVTATSSTCLKLHKSALEMVPRDRLARYIEEARHEFTSDDELQDRGYRDSLWNRFKHSQVKVTLKEGGKLHFLNHIDSEVIHERPMEKEEIYVENMRRFVLKGSQFEPLRSQSARPRLTSVDLPPRPNTVIGNNQDEETTPPPLPEEHNDTPDDDNDNVDGPKSSLMTVEKAKEMEKKIMKKNPQRNTVCKVLFKAMESKESLMKILEETEVSPHVKQAWKAGGGQETQNFMKNGVLVTMTSEDIVRKAKALADTYADKWKNKFSEAGEEEWDTILHAENKQAKMLISANKMRIKDLRRKMAALQKQREKTRRSYAQRNGAKVLETDDKVEKTTDIFELAETDFASEEPHINGLATQSNELNNTDETLT